MENKSIKLTVSGEINWENDLSQSLCSNDQAYDIEAELDWDFDCSERLLDYQLSAEFEKESTRPLIGKGPTVHIGFDSEFVPGDKEKPNTVLSLQFYLIGEGGIIQRVIYPPNNSKRDRPSFDSTINFLIMEAIEDGVILQWPKQIIICGFFLRIDLPAFGDFVKFKADLENVGGRVASVKHSVDIELNDEDRARLLKNRTLFNTDRDGIFRLLKVKFIDLGGHAVMGTSLAQIGDLLELPKLNLPEGYTKDRMDLLLKGDKQFFESYGLRDAEIAVKFYLRLKEFATKTLGCNYLPATASSLSVNMFIDVLKKSGVDFNAAFGVKQVSTTYWHTEKERIETKKEKLPIPMRAIFEPFISSCFNGGRNECFAFGPSATGMYNDFDLAGAYTTGLVDLKLFDYENVKVTNNSADFRGHVLGFAYVRFSFPTETILPSLPVRNGSNGLIFPLTGYSYCTAPEIEVALNLGCEIEIKHGIIIPWLDSDERLFESFVKRIRELRESFIAEKGDGCLDEQYIKLLGNSLYGKTAQGLKDKTVFEAGTMKSVQLPHSLITNAAIAAHTTGFIRALLSELIAAVPSHRTVISATTDGFITDAEEAELRLDGPMAKRFEALCERVVPGSNMLKLKHKVRQVIPFKTRGQITGLNFEDSPIILAKAGVSVALDITGDVSADEVSRMQNDFMLELFLNRKPEDKTAAYPFTSFREQWTKDSDVVRFTSVKKLNLEFDFKRQLVNPRMIAVNETEHVALDSKPWTSLDDFERSRVIFDGWRRKNCLKTINDYENWDDIYQFTILRDQLIMKGVKGFGVRATNKGLADVLRRLFLRCYTQELCGLSKKMTYRELAEWLTQRGYLTKVDEVKNAKRSTFIENCVPATNSVMKLATILIEGFPDIEMNKILAI
jgi:hypothetical protein